MLNQFDSAVLAKPCSQWRDMLHNQLATAAEGVTPQLAELREKIARSISQPVRLTGSGSGMFVLCETREEAEGVLNKLDADIRKN